MQDSIFGQYRIFGGKEGIDSNQLILIANVQPTDEGTTDSDEKIESLCAELAEVKKFAQDSNEKLEKLIKKLCPDSDGEEEGDKKWVGR